MLTPRKASDLFLSRYGWYPSGSTMPYKTYGDVSFGRYLPPSKTAAKPIAVVPEPISLQKSHYSIQDRNFAKRIWLKIPPKWYTRNATDPFLDVLIKYRHHRTYTSYRAGSCSDGLRCGGRYVVSASIKRGHPYRGRVVFLWYTFVCSTWYHGNLKSAPIKKGIWHFTHGWAKRINNGSSTFSLPIVKYSGRRFYLICCFLLLYYTDIAKYRHKGRKRAHAPQRNRWIGGGFGFLWWVMVLKLVWILFL